MRKVDSGEMSASQDGGDLSCTSGIDQTVSRPHIHPPKVARSLTTNHYSLTTAVGRPGLRPSLVQGLRPRNAPPLLATVLILPQHNV